MNEFKFPRFKHLVAGQTRLKFPKTKQKSTHAHLNIVDQSK